MKKGTLFILICALFLAPAARAEEDSKTLFKKAEECFDKKNYKQAKQILRQLVAKHPLEDFIPRARLLLANLQEDFTVSIMQFKELASEYNQRPEGEEAQKNLGARYYLADKYAEAVESYQEFIHDYPKSNFLPEINYWYGSSLMALDKDNDAANQFKKVVEKAPDSPWAPKALLGMGSAYMKQKKYGDAEKQYRRILDQYEYYEELNLVYFKLGQAYEGRKKFKEGYAAYQTLLAKYPKSFEVEEAKARVAVLEQDHPEFKPAQVKAVPVPTATPLSNVVTNLFSDKTPTPEPVDSTDSPKVEPTFIPVVAEAKPTPTQEIQEPPPATPFHVQVGVFSKDANVRKAKKDVQKAGYKPFVLKVKAPGVPYTLYKVRVGKFGGRAEAEELAKELTAKLREKAIVVED